MQVAQIKDGSITAIQYIQQKPIYDGGQWWDLADSAVRQEWFDLYGWIEVAKVAQPVDTATGTWTLDTQLVNGIPTQVWVERPWTADELAGQVAQAQREVDRQIVKTIVTNLQAEKTRVQTIIDKTNASLTLTDMKDIARAAKRIADAAIDIARFVKDN